jgi:thiamine kinase-like enzyme
LPCDVLARVVPLGWKVATLELDLAQRLTESGGPIGRLDPRVEPRIYERDGFGVTFWTYYDGPTAENAGPGEYAHALAHLHETMRSVDITTPHYLDRVAEAQSLVDNPAYGREFTDDDRQLLSTTLRTLREKVVRRVAAEQLLHGEPHPGNVLQTKHGLLFIDLETCCRGPVEFDLAHAPEDAAAHYPGADQDLLDDCRLLTLALATAWRFEPDEQLPDRHRRTEEWLSQLRASVYGLNSGSVEKAER